MIELLGATALVVAVIDTEPAPFDRSTLDRMLLAGRAVELSLLVRVPGSKGPDIQAALAMGAAGVMVSNVDWAEQARQVVSLATFKGGKRGFFHLARWRTRVSPRHRLPCSAS